MLSNAIGPFVTPSARHQGSAFSRGFGGDVAKWRADHSREKPITDQKNAEDTADDREDLKAGLDHY